MINFPQNIRRPYARAIANYRDLTAYPWDLAGIDAALVKLAQTSSSVGEAMTIALTAALLPDARTPEAIHDQTLREGLTEAASKPSPHRQIPPCPTHGGITTRGPGGPYACCAFDDPEQQTNGTKETP